MLYVSSYIQANTSGLNVVAQIASRDPSLCHGSMKSCSDILTVIVQQLPPACKPELP